MFSNPIQICIYLSSDLSEIFMNKEYGTQVMEKCRQ